MKTPLHDTTDPTTYRQVRAFFDRTQSQGAPGATPRLAFEIVGFYESTVGPSWSSNGKLESDYFHHVHFAVSGSAEVVHQGIPIRLEPGWAYFLPGNTPVERRCLKSYSLLFLKCRCEWIPGVDLLIDWPGRKPTRLGKWDPRDWKMPNTAGKTVSANVLLKWQGLLSVWFADAFPNLDEILSHHLAGHSRFAAVLDLIEQDLGADLRVEDLARSHGTSLHAFSMAFMRALGISPKAYLNRRINQEAIRLVSNSALPIKEIADKLRFSDGYYFSRFFSKMNGRSPQQYRESAHG